MIASAWPHLKTLEVSRSDSLTDCKAVDSLAGMHLLVDLQRNLRSQWLARHLRSSHGVPYFACDKAQLRRSRLLLEARMRGRRKPLPDDARKTNRPQYETMVDALRRGLKQHLPEERHDGIDTLTVRPRLPVPDDIDNPWRKELRFGAWLAVAPGAAHPTKQAPLSLMISILERVQRQMVELNGKAPKPLGLLFVGYRQRPSDGPPVDGSSALAWTGDESGRQTQPVGKRGRLARINDPVEQRLVARPHCGISRHTDRCAFRPNGGSLRIWATDAAKPGLSY